MKIEYKIRRWVSLSILTNTIVSICKSPYIVYRDSGRRNYRYTEATLTKKRRLARSSSGDLPELLLVL